MRSLIKLLNVGLPIIGVIVILSAVLFLRDIHGQIAIVMVGIVLIEAGVWKLAHQFLPNDRQFHALRDEIETFVQLSRQLNETALAMKVDESMEHRRKFDEVQTAMHETVDHIASVAGKTAAELAVESKPAVAL